MCKINIFEFMKYCQKNNIIFHEKNQSKWAGPAKDIVQLKIEHFWAGSLKKAVVDGDIENGSLMAGQSVSLVKKIQPVKDILNEFVNQANQQLKQESKVL